MTATVAPYGTWVSPVTVELLTAAAIGLGGLSADGSDLLWLEVRPSENGRTALCRRRADGSIADLTPPPFNVGSRVHEYGGGAYAASNGTIIFSERKDGSLWLIEGNCPPRRIETPEGCRYADFEFDQARRRVIAVREDHRDRPPTDPKAALVAFPLAPGARESVLFEGPDFLSSPRLSPDGQKICFLAWDHPDMPWDRTRLLMADIFADGTLGPQNLVAGETLDQDDFGLNQSKALARDAGGKPGATFPHPAPEAIVQPCWSPDGTLLFASDRNGWWNPYAFRSGAIEPQAPVEAEIGGPHWVFRQTFFMPLPDGRIIASMVKDAIRTVVLITGEKITPLPSFGQVYDCPRPFGDEFAFIATPPTEPPSLRIASGLEAREPIVVRTSAPASIPPESISLGETIRFPTPGGTGHAFWYPPKNREYHAPQGELPPLIVLSHGGPTSMTTNAFSLGIQWWTSRGFGVVDVNYRGSTGYGRDYRDRLKRCWGVADVEDCIAAALSLIDRGLVDPARIAIRGGSAGGFTTLAALTSSDVFKAGASLYGVADLMLLARDTHKFESRYLEDLIGPLPAKEALYFERSPIHHVEQINCPVIFFQGEDDKTVPPNQAGSMVAALRGKNLPVAYYLFEDEGHGFRKAETLRRVLELELDFYGRVFGFTPPNVSERVVIDNMG
jgi:dipeptidyl aminopeptidase/acylaminoacyl peptidase